LLRVDDEVIPLIAFDGNILNVIGESEVAGVATETDLQFTAGAEILDVGITLSGKYRNTGWHAKAP
jgi:hypothetical protein